MLDFIIEIVTKFFDLIKTIVVTLETVLTTALDFIVFIFIKLPFVITNDILGNLPTPIDIILISLYSVVLFVGVFKLLRLVKFW